MTTTYGYSSGGDLTTVTCSGGVATPPVTFDAALRLQVVDLKQSAVTVNRQTATRYGDNAFAKSGLFVWTKGCQRSGLVSGFLRKP